MHVRHAAGVIVAAVTGEGPPAELKGQRVVMVAGKDVSKSTFDEVLLIITRVGRPLTMSFVPCA